jgi:hypothetical protein
VVAREALPQYTTWNVIQYPDGTVSSFFRIDGHPAQDKDKTWVTTKLSTVSYEEKLKKVIQKLEFFDKQIVHECESSSTLLKVAEPVTSSCSG